MGIQDIERGVGDLSDKLDHIGAAISKIAEKNGVGTEISAEKKQIAMDQLLINLAKGEKLEAIKQLRTATGLPLKNANDWVTWALEYYKIERKRPS